jgi:rhomboid family GlyGly-CTERM serine protease
VLLAPALLNGVGMRPALDWRPGVATSEPWRWWSAAWVHLSTAHLAANAAGTVLIAALGVAARLPWRATTAWAMAWPLTHAALVLGPPLSHYGGLSGVLHAGAAVTGTWLALHERGRSRGIGAALLAGLTVKVLLEAPWRTELPYAPALGIHTVPFAHAAGAVAGTLCALLWGRCPPSRP